MQTTICDPVEQRMWLYDPVSGKSWNPATQALEPFDPGKHLLAIPAATVQLAAGVTLPAGFAADVAALKSFGDGDALARNRRLVQVLVSVDGSGAPIQILGNPMANPHAPGAAPAGAAVSGS